MTANISRYIIICMVFDRIETCIEYYRIQNLYNTCNVRITFDLIVMILVVNVASDYSAYTYTESVLHTLYSACDVLMTKINV